MKPLLYLRDRTLPLLALVLAYQREMGSKPQKRRRAARQRELPLFTEPTKEAPDAQR